MWFAVGGPLVAVLTLWLLRDGGLAFFWASLAYAAWSGIWWRSSPQRRSNVLAFNAMGIAVAFALAEGAAALLAPGVRPPGGAVWKSGPVVRTTTAPHRLPEDDGEPAPGASSLRRVERPQPRALGVVRCDRRRVARAGIGCPAQLCPRPGSFRRARRNLRPPPARRRSWSLEKVALSDVREGVLYRARPLANDVPLFEGIGYRWSRSFFVPICFAPSSWGLGAGRRSRPRSIGTFA